MYWEQNGFEQNSMDTKCNNFDGLYKKETLINVTENKFNLQRYSTSLSTRETLVLESNV
jgi:hypothetical protein